MYLHEAAGLMFLASPRTASRATARALRSVGFHDLSDRILGTPSAIHHMSTAVVSQHLDLGDDWTIFYTVRNHWDAIASWMFARDRSPTVPFMASEIEAVAAENATWIGERTLWHLHGGPGRIVLRYESLAADLSAVLAAHAIDAPDLPPVGVSEERRGRPARELFTDGARDYVGARFAQEIARYGYSFA